MTPTVPAERAAARRKCPGEQSGHDQHMGENGYEQLVAHLKERGSDEILWGDPHEEQHVEGAGRIFSGWIDVHVPDIQEACGFNWVWTIEDLADRPEDWEPGFFTIDVPYDLHVHAVWDPYAIEHPGQNGHKGWYEGRDVHLVASNPDTTPTAAEVQQLEEALEAGPHRQLRTFGAWRETTVNTAITTWVKEHTGRDVTAMFEPDQPLSGMHAALAERLEKGPEESYLIGVSADGTEIQASAEAFEALMGLDPETATEAMSVIQQIVASIPREKPGE